MNLLLGRFALLVLVVSACTAAPQPTRPPPVFVSPQFASVAANPDAARILSALRAPRLPVMPSDVSRVDLLAGAPGFAWRVGPDWLHVHDLSGLRTVQ